MTIYRYKCKDCKAEFELFSDEEEQKCLGCGSQNLEKNEVEMPDLGCGADSGCSSCHGCSQ